ncbi:bola-like protein [Coniochaeta ligniaria NRRL 30616]|uniref:Bola-like protein n=1 Tax=Coniochaeta ligniaria NRRL 30616 TaxID=1408157 RepID=A0A1J7IGB4_9PEZI|nr:bola-like protein [Coniochaeta ligniaria NRRL 30616]
MSRSQTCQVSFPPSFSPLTSLSHLRLLSQCPNPFETDRLSLQLGGCGQAFTSLIVSPEFAGKNSLKRHRLVNTALKDEIALIHAWSAKCQTPEEWEKEKAATGGNDGPFLDGTVGGKVVGTDA